MAFAAQHIGPRRKNGIRVIRFHPAVHLKKRMAVGPVDHGPDCGDLRYGVSRSFSKDTASAGYDGRPRS